MDILARAVGRRKEAVAQVQIKLGTGLFIINNKPAQEYLQNDYCSLLSVKAPFNILSISNQTNGLMGQALLSNSNFSTQLPNLLSTELKNQDANASHELRSSGLEKQQYDQNQDLQFKISDAQDFSTSKTHTQHEIDKKADETVVKLDTIVTVKGGGLKGQTEAIRLGISRAICLLSSTTNNVLENSTVLFTETPLNLSNVLEIRKQLKDKGYLTQDSRVKERRKYGLKKARKASQYHKR
uniref:Small ribosomal subunit protein uS9c n=1 Tax=Pandorina colemaniae TaxID=47786 RepID=A0A6C0RWL6_9CHLO|nr:ribosomal protein S9 [Pandorina colemaniae]